MNISKQIVFIFNRCIKLRDAERLGCLNKEQIIVSRRYRNLALKWFSKKKLNIYSNQIY